MKVLLIIATSLLGVLALLSALLWMGSRRRRDGGRQGTDELDYLLTLSAVFIGLACISGVTLLALPGSKKGTGHD